MSKQFTVIMSNERSGRDYTPNTGTLDELIEAYRYTLEKGKSWEHEKGNSKINLNPRGIKSLINNLNNAESNAAANGYSMISFRQA